MISTVTLKHPEDIAEFLAAQAGTLTEYRQFSRGPADLQYMCTDLGDVVLLWAKGNAHCLWRDHVRDDDQVRFGFVIRAEDEVLVQGRDVNKSGAVVWIDGAETEYLFKGAVETLEIIVSPQIAENLGWRVAGPVFQSSSLQALTHLANIGQAVTKAVKLHPDMPRRLIERLRASVLEAMEPAIMPWLDLGSDENQLASSSVRNYLRFRSAEDAFCHLLAPDVAMDDLSKHVGVSRRSLELAFRNCVGVGPRRYFEVQRLHALRAALFSARSDEHTVTRLAYENGFGDLGRMAKKYQFLFGEKPSDTLARFAYG